MMRASITSILVILSSPHSIHGFLASNNPSRYNKISRNNHGYQQQQQSSLSSSSDTDHEPFINRRQIIQSTAATTAALLGNDLYIPSAYAETTTIPTTKLGTLSISRTIQGYWQLAGGHGKYQESDAIQNMKAHYNVGITTLDTADIYGPSERIMGKFLKEEPRAVACTKFCGFRFLDEIDRKEVRERVDRARERLQVDTLPLVQFFWSNYDIKRYVDVALMLSELKAQGLIQELGVTNFDLKRLKEFKNADVPIVSNQVQLSALDRRPVQSGMADWCLDNNVKLIAFGTVASGILSEQYLNAKAPSAEQQNTASLRMYSKTASRFGSWGLVQELLKTMDGIAADLRSSGKSPNASIANVAQRYVLDGTPAVASVLIGVRNQKHIMENVNTHSFTLAKEEIQRIDDVVEKRAGPKGDVWDIERGYV